MWSPWGEWTQGLFFPFPSWQFFPSSCLRGPPGSRPIACSSLPCTGLAPRITGAWVPTSHLIHFFTIGKGCCISAPRTRAEPRPWVSSTPASNQRPFHNNPSLEILRQSSIEAILLSLPILLSVTIGTPHSTPILPSILTTLRYSLTYTRLSLYFLCSWGWPFWPSSLLFPKC